MSTSERIDPRDAEVFDAWYDVHRAAQDEGREFPVSWAREEMRVGMLAESPYSDKELWAVRDDAGAIAGTMYLELPMKDNTALVEVAIGVRADVRRQGYGTALAGMLEERAAAFGRTVLQSAIDVPIDGEQTAGQAFAAAHGLTVANVEVHRVLELPLAEDFLAGLAAKAAEHHQGYELVSWQNRCPDEYVDAYAALQATFNLEAPMGELELEAQTYDAARVRVVEQQSIDQGRNGWITVAVAPDGTLAGHTELYVGVHDARNAYQWGTLVSPAHRGHRLGLALKVRNHTELQRSHSERRIVHTWNAEQNTAMNAVNATLGYRPVELAQELQRRI
ncbi:GNAT family N-acetyltransferase [Kribbella qitaiheensis]|uniref:GNAT family N-acetyltransferase n=1 Tax=Kribbella qitaiheensis TaxID=1544730 RepID=A0A7G6WYC3_9ACTN|nr:GNAT family N-acetyltransferase [Kribbella qitaiheensis]QNE18988.1 GNAT family N-acetyltransferase [Kribbella qitaiheensis]